MTPHVALYCRISVDRSGRREGVDAQERWGREYAARTWPGLPVKVFDDNDVSAANGGPRPGFDLLRKAVAAGEITHLWAVEQSRLERDEVGWFILAAELDAAGIGEVHTKRDGIVQVRSDVAGIKAVINAGEVRRIKGRVLDRLADNAAHGRPPGGRIFGYRSAINDDGEKTLAVVPEQAAAIRFAAEKLLAGESLEAVARQLRSRGLRGTRGGEITLATVKRMVTTPTVAALRIHQGELTGVDGNWEPILSPDTFAALRDKLTSATRQRARRRYLLSGGMITCAVCGHDLAGMVKRWRNHQVPSYVCHPTRGGPGCVGIMAEPVEEHVAAMLLDELDRPEFLAALADDEHESRREELVAELSAVERQRRVATAMWGLPAHDPKHLTMDEWQVARATLVEREQEARSALAELPPPVADVDIAAVRSAWPEMTLGERREIVGLFVDRVIINPAVPGTRAFDSGRVVIRWREL